MQDKTIAKKIQEATKNIGDNVGVPRRRVHEINVPLYLSMAVFFLCCTIRFSAPLEQLHILGITILQIVALFAMYCPSLRIWDRLSIRRRYIGIGGDMKIGLSGHRGLFIGTKEMHGSIVMLVTYWDDPRGSVYEYFKHPREIEPEELDINEMLLCPNPIIRKIGYACTRSC